MTIKTIELWKAVRNDFWLHWSTAGCINSVVFVASQFTNSLWEVSSYFRDDTDVVVCLNKLIHALQEMNKFHSILLDQASRTILKNLTSFVKG
jgi:hypothetical protein